MIYVSQIRKNERPKITVRAEAKETAEKPKRKTRKSKEE